MAGAARPLGPAELASAVAAAAAYFDRKPGPRSPPADVREKCRPAEIAANFVSTEWNCPARVGSAVAESRSRFPPTPTS